jgi:hypothetical protein
VRILLDHCLPRRLKHALTVHEAATAAEMGCDRLRNGELLAAVAAGGFELFLTIDKNLKFQQNLATLPVAVAVLMAQTNRFGDLAGFLPALEEALKTIQPRTLVEITVPNP